MTKLRLGTRGSLLALTQSRGVARDLEERTGVEVEIEVIHTTGDLRLDRPLSEIGGKGLFTKELDVALIEGRIDFAVHSLKDLPTLMDPSLAVASIPVREDPRDVLIGPAGSRAVTLSSLPPGAVVGTSSLRRRALTLAFRPDLQVTSIRGNLDTRLRKVDEGEVDAILLAGAGIRRVGWTDRIHEWIEGGAWLSAPGQGALGIVARSDDPEVAHILSHLHDPPTAAAVTAERALLHELEGGCQVPIGSLATVFGDQLRLRGVVASPDGTRVVVAESTGPSAEPDLLGRRVAELLLHRGAGGILDAVRSEAGPREGAG